MRYFILSLLLPVAFLAVSCSHKSRTANVEKGEQVKLEYARNIQITRMPRYYKVVVDDPWHHGGVLQTYYLAEGGGKSEMTDSGVIVGIPLRRAVVTTTAHANLLVMLGRGEAIAGVADPKYMHIPYIHRRLAHGSVTDCGSSMSPDLERIISVSPDGVLISPYEGSGSFGRLGKIGVPIIYTADYMEPTALGRAEWMKFYGLLFGCQQKADSLFDEVKENYNRLKAKAARLKKTSVLTEKLAGSVWYVPGGCSSTGTMLADAGADYAFAKDKHSGSVSFNVEQVLSRGASADVWFFSVYQPNDITLSSLWAENKAYGQIKAFKNKHVYSANTMRVPFFEEVSFRPDLLLNDYLLMLHPEDCKGKLRYYKLLR